MTINRPQFDLLDAVRIARRWQNDTSHMVLPPDIADQLETELTRLYALEDAINEIAIEYATGTAEPMSGENIMRRLGVLP